MSSSPHGSRPPTWGLLTLTSAAILFVAACGSSAAPAAAGSTTSAPAATSAPVSASAPASASAAGTAAGAVVMTHSSDLGTFLTDGSGRTLYLWEADTGTTSKCSGTCATIWPPLTTTGAPTAGSGASAGMLSTTTRSDGSKQVTYNGHPLYYFAADKAAGDTKGQGSSGFGAKWWVLSATGQSITGSGGGGGSGGSSGSVAPSSSPSSSSGGSGGGWS